MSWYALNKSHPFPAQRHNSSPIISRFCLNMSTKNGLKCPKISLLTWCKSVLKSVKYLGSCLLERWIEPQSRRSYGRRRRRASRLSCLFSAMAAIDPANVIQVVVTEASHCDLASAERIFFGNSNQPATFGKSITEPSIWSLCPSVPLRGWCCDVRKSPSSAGTARFGCEAMHPTVTDRLQPRWHVMPAQPVQRSRLSTRTRALPQVIIHCVVPQHIISHT